MPQLAIRLRQVGVEFVGGGLGVRGLLGFSGLLGSEEEELEFAGGRRIEALAHKDLLALAHDQDRSLTSVVNLLVRRGFGGWIAHHTGIFLA